MAEALITTPGTNCLTQAEDRIAAAIRVSEAWRKAVYRPHEQGVEYADMPLAEQSKADAAVRVDQFDRPRDGLAFSDAELFERGTMCMVAADFDDGLSISNNVADGVTALIQMKALVVIEHPLAKRANSQRVNQVRNLKELIVPLAFQLHAALQEYGYRYSKGLAMVQQPTLVQSPLKTTENKPVRLQATLGVLMGPGEGLGV